MVTIGPSRFAGLRIEDDEDEVPARPPTVQKTKKPQNNNNKNKKKKKASKGPKPSIASTSADQQNDHWANNEEDRAAAEYEKDLREALLLSKLEYEASKQNEQGAVGEKLPSKKNKKGKPVNLQQFLSNPKLEAALPAANKLLHDKVASDFFEKINDEVKNILKKDERTALDFVLVPPKSVKKAAKDKSVPVDPKAAATSNGSSTAECSTDILKQALETENKELKKEIKALQLKFKKVTDIVKDAEMKEKIDLMRENQRLQTTHAELTQLIENLAVELSQEKSKVSHLMANGNTSKNGVVRKSVRFDANPEVYFVDTE